MKILEDLSIIEDGLYVALGFGYYVQIAFQNGNISPKLKCDFGIRGFSTMIIEIKDGVGTFFTDNHKEVNLLMDSYRVRPNFLKQY